MLVLVASVCGCRDVTLTTAPEPVALAETVAQKPSRETSQPTSTSSRFTREPSETWDVLRIQSTYVGYQHIQIEPFVQDGEPLVRIQSSQLLKLKRFEQNSEQKLTTTCVETPQGWLRRFEVTESTGREINTTVGTVANDKLKIITKNGGKSEQLELDWRDENRGWYSVDHSLRDKPLHEGESRTIQLLIPVVNQMAEVQLQAGKREKTMVMDREMSLLRIRRKDLLAGTTIESILWCDDDGDTLKTFMVGLGLETHRSTKDIATRDIGNGGFDLGNSTTVRLSRPISNPHGKSQLVYRATIQDGDPAEIFASGISQHVRRLNEHQAEILVKAIRPDPQAEATGPQPVAGDREPNNWIQSDDPIIDGMAKRAAADEADPWLVACRLEQFVQSGISNKNFTQAFLSASEVAKSLEGDCTEHAVLLAALCRNRGIPARVAVGLVYYAPAAGFAYHMWNEVWLGNRWIPLDGTLGKGGIGAGHLKLTTSNLQGIDSRAVFLPVSQVIGRLQLELAPDDGSQPFSNK